MKYLLLVSLLFLTSCSQCSKSSNEEFAREVRKDPHGFVCTRPPGIGPAKRCENTEAICYGQYDGWSCHWKNL